MIAECFITDKDETWYFTDFRGYLLSPRCSCWRSEKWIIRQICFHCKFPFYPMNNDNTLDRTLHRKTTCGSKNGKRYQHFWHHSYTCTEYFNLYVWNKIKNLNRNILFCMTCHPVFAIGSELTCFIKVKRVSEL